MKNKNIIGVLLLVAIFFVVSYFQSSSLKIKAAASAKKGGQWLLNTSVNFSDPGVLWAMSEMNNNFCHKGISEVVNEYRHWANYSPQEQAYIRLIDPSQVFLLDYRSLKEREKFYDDMLIPAVYCDLKPLPQDTKEKIFNYQQTSGYDLTHRYLAMLFLKRNNCLSAEVEENLPKISKQLFEEQSRAPFSDLFAERTIFLQLGGFAVGTTWIEKIINSQNKSGGWSDASFAPPENPHTVALSTWALAEYSTTCPFGP